MSILGSRSASCLFGDLFSKFFTINSNAFELSVYLVVLLKLWAFLVVAVILVVEFEETDLELVGWVCCLTIINRIKKILGVFIFEIKYSFEYSVDFKNF